MEQQDTKSSWFSIFTGIALLLVFIVFLALKLAQIGLVATWSWWWVTAPVWAPVLLQIIRRLFWGIVWLVLFVYNRTFNRKKHDAFMQHMKEVADKKEAIKPRWQKKLEEMERNSK